VGQSFSHQSNAALLQLQNRPFMVVARSDAIDGEIAAFIGICGPVVHGTLLSGPCGTSTTVALFAPGTRAVTTPLTLALFRLTLKSSVPSTLSCCTKVGHGNLVGFAPAGVGLVQTVLCIPLVTVSVRWTASGTHS
jgi:hypothetical protein